jgi:hypothetical protein
MTKGERKYETILIHRDQSCFIDEDARMVMAARNDQAEFKQLYRKWLKRVIRDKWVN